MFQHLILGLLRDQKPRHAYALAAEYERVSGNQAYSGNASRTLHKLQEDGLVTREDNIPGNDERRIPYAITAQGCQVFDDWLVSRAAFEDDFSTWLLFVDRVPPAVRDEFLDRREDELWFALKSLNRAREDALAAVQRNGTHHFSAEAAQLRRRIMQASADLEFIRELRTELSTVPDGATRTAGGRP